MNRRREMSLKLMLALAAGLCLGGGVGNAQEALPTGPSPELKKLEFLLGKATGKGKMQVPGGQGTIDWSATDNTAWTKDGRYLKSESKVNYPGMGDDESLTLIAYDQKAKVYKLWRYSSWTTMPIEATGNFVGSKLVMTTKMMESGQVFRVTFDPKAKGEVSFLLEMELADGFQKIQEGLFTTKS
jgi:hypothetical protein